MPDFHPRFMATGIGTLPITDPDRAVEEVLSRLTEMPYWPQLPVRDPMEDMGLQYTPALTPLVQADPAAREVRAHPGLSREEALAAFYERLWSGELSTFALSPEVAAGFPVFLAKVAALGPSGPAWVKGHVTGPLTQAAGIIGSDGKALIFDDEMAEALARGLGAAAAAQALQLAVLGKPTLMFFDEPYLTGYGSAFNPLSRERVMELLAAAFEELRNRAPGVLAGVHVCGNTDWAMVADSGTDVVNLDAHGFGANLMLYPEAMSRLLERGGAVAWGAVPTLEFTGGETAQGLWSALKSHIEGLAGKGLDIKRIAEQSLVTPACGMGSLTMVNAGKILDLTAEISDLARKEFF